jgi:hypothetical protein
MDCYICRNETTRNVFISINVSLLYVIHELFVALRFTYKSYRSTVRWVYYMKPLDELRDESPDKNVQKNADKAKLITK